MSFFIEVDGARCSPIEDMFSKQSGLRVAIPAGFTTRFPCRTVANGRRTPARRRPEHIAGRSETTCRRRGQPWREPSPARRDPPPRRLDGCAGLARRVPRAACAASLAQIVARTTATPRRHAGFLGSHAHLKHLRMFGLCLAAVFAIAAVSASSAFAGEPEWGKCVAQAGGKYLDGNCQTKGKGGSFEWKKGSKPAQRAVHGGIRRERRGA